MIFMLGDRIQQIRKYKKISQKEFAEILEIPVSTLANYENNHRQPNVDTLYKIAKALDVSIDEFLKDGDTSYKDLEVCTKALRVLINSINGQLKEFNKSNFKIYDADNRDWYLKSIEYCKEDDKLIFYTEEDGNEII